MDQLKQRFRERLAARIAAIRSALADLEEAPEDARAALRRIGHALHGSGGTYGFPEISAAARTVELAADDDLLPAVEQLLAILDREHLATDDRRFRVLVVDDDPEVTLLLRAAVAPLDAQIVSIETAADARRVLAAEEYGLVVLDLLLPDADGRTVLLWMREQESLAETPVFVMSGLSSARVQAECYAIGADGFFEKPIDPDVVRAAITARLSVRNPRKPVRPKDEAEVEASLAPPRTGKRVLLVEDDDLVATIIKHRLTRAGFEIEHFSDGVEARDNARADGLCLAILDIKVPGIDGFELLENLRSRPDFARVPVIILTSLGSERDVVRGLKLGASDYMLKPFSPTELLARVHRLIHPT